MSMTKFSRGALYILAGFCVLGAAWVVLTPTTSEPVVANNEMDGQSGTSELTEINPNKNTKLKNTVAANGMRAPESPNIETADAMAGMADDLLIENDEVHVEMSAYTDPIGVEGRLFAQATAHMSGVELVAFRELRGNEIVRTFSGVLNPNYVVTNNCQDTICVDQIIDTTTNAVVFDGAWAKGFNATGVGKEVVRVK